MFERYTEVARRTLFFARYEASQSGAVSIETEHLLLGLAREASALSVLATLPLEHLRSELESRVIVRERVSTSVEIPFSRETKRVLEFAAQEADALGHAHIGIEHLLLGLLREEDSVAATTLAAHGVRLSDVRAKVEQLPFPLQASPRRLALLQIDGMKTLVEQLAQKTAGNPEALQLIALIDAALDGLRANLGG